MPYRKKGLTVVGTGLPLEDYEPPIDYTLVYQGGHHNVYCNGEKHIYTRGGGTTKITIAGYDREGCCDCERWKNVD